MTDTTTKASASHWSLEV